MGSKKLKGIAFHGKKRREIADPSSLKRLSRAFKERVKGNEIIYMYKKYGTPMLVSIMNTIGAFPTQYWSKGTLEGWEGISAESLMERCQVSSIACPSCFMSCGKISEVKQGASRPSHHGTGIRNDLCFRGLCMVNSIEEIIYLNDLCDRLGIDTITAGNLAAFAIEASKSKKIKDNLHYGEVDGIAEILTKIAYRKGVGRILSEGSAMPQKCGRWRRRQSMSRVWSPRALIQGIEGNGLAYATSDRGPAISGPPFTSLNSRVRFP